jgi:hypothetical protein
MSVFEPLYLRLQANESPAFAGLSWHSGGGIRTRDLRVMRLRQVIVDYVELGFKQNS